LVELDEPEIAVVVDPPDVTVGTTVDLPGSSFQTPTVATPKVKSV
jgi:hypothetical protein